MLLLQLEIRRRGRRSGGRASYASGPDGCLPERRVGRLLFLRRLD